MRHISEAELEGLISLDDAMSALRDALIAHARGDARVQMRVTTEHAGLRLNTMAAVVPSLAVCGAKVYTAVNSKFCFVVLLFSLEDGRLIATLEANALTRLRTAAVSALAARHLARSESTTLAVFGRGTQARAHTEALRQVFPISEILVVGRAGAPELTNAEEAASRADIIVTATRSRTPVLDGAKLREGCCVLAIGSARPDAAEVDARTFERAARICVEDSGQARHEAGDLIAAEAAGVAVWSRLVELGAILDGKAPGRTSEREITVFESLGFALEDVALAALAWSRLALPSEA
jgi:ornithine cyclodeaminase